jgi:hypothetical protein
MQDPSVVFCCFCWRVKLFIGVVFPPCFLERQPALNVNSSAAAYPFVARLYYFMLHLFDVDILFDAVADFYNIHSLPFCVGGSDGGRDTRT